VKFAVPVGIAIALFACNEARPDRSACDGQPCDPPPDVPVEPAPPSCGTHADCLQSGLCLLDEHTCAAIGDVAYAAGPDVVPAGTDNANCSRDTPCSKVDSASATHRAYWQVSGTIDGAVMVTDALPRAIYGVAGAKLTHTGTSDPVVTVNHDDAALKLYDVEISDIKTDGTDAVHLQSGSLVLVRVRIIDNPNLGIRADGGSLQVTQSMLVRNAGGGMLVRDTATFKVVNNLFDSNGGPTADQGGIRIKTAESHVNQLDYNTFVNNSFKRSVAAAIQCTAGTFVARNNLLCNNGTVSQQPQFEGCQYAYTDVWPDTAPSGTTNFVADPKFIGPDFHPSASLVIGHGDPEDDPRAPIIDLDGMSRPRPATVGAYESAPAR
jgi:hypothetical protein